MQWFRFVAIGVMAIQLWGCGGGGGSGGSGPSTPSFSISLDRQSLTFDVTTGTYTPSQNILATGTGTPPDTVYVGAVVDGEGIEPDISISINGMQATISVRPISGLAVGDYSGRILFLACSDSVCDHPIGGTPLAVAYTIRVHVPNGITPNPIPLAAAAGVAANQIVAVRFPQTNAPFTVTVDGNPEWLTITNQSTSGFQVNARGLPPGLYTATLRATAGSQSYSATLNHSVSSSPLTLTAVSGETATGTLVAPLGVNASTYSATVTQGSEWLSITQQSPGVITVVARSLPAQQYVGVVTVVSGSTTYAHSIVYKVGPSGSPLRTLSVAPSNLTLNTVEGAVSSATAIAVTTPSWNPPLKVTTTYGGTATNWLQVTPSPTGYNVVANAAVLSAGTYSATLGIDPGWPQSEILIPVALTVGVGLVQPSTVIIPVNSSSTASSLLGSVSIQVQGPAVNWTATDNAPWLTITRAAGTSGSQLEFQIDTGLLDALNNFEVHVAKVTVTPATPTMSAVTFDVNVEKRIAEVTGLGPYYLQTSKSNKLIVRGRGFNGVAALPSMLRIAGVTFTNAQVVNDVEITADLPALPVGSYAVRVDNVLTLATTERSFKILAPQSLAYQTVVSGSRSRAFIFDDARQALYATEDNLLKRYKFNGATWDVDSVAIPDLANVGLSNTGTSIVVTSRDGHVQFLNPTSLAVTTNIASPWPTFAFAEPNGLPVVNDGRIFLNTGSTIGIAYFDPNAATFGFVDSNYYLNITSGFLYGVSGNGERLVLPQSSGSNYPTFLMDARNPILLQNPSLLAFNAPVLMNEDGSRVSFGEGILEIRDANFNSIGRAAVPSTEPDLFYRTQQLSPDGSRAYIIASLASDISIDVEPAAVHPLRVYVFDTGTVPTGSTTIPPLGYFEIPDQPSCRAILQCSVNLVSTISKDGRTLFISGSGRILVVPIPTDGVLQPLSLSAPSSSEAQIKSVATGMIRAHFKQ
jgi:hypothetical protein